MSAPILKLLVVGNDEELIQWLRRMIAAHKVPFRVKVTEPLRLGAPEVQALSHDLILILWNRQPLVTLEAALARVAPKERAPEGSLMEIESIGGEPLLQRTVAFGRNFGRDDTVLLAETGVKLVLALPEKRSHWDDEGATILQRLAHHREEAESLQNRPEEQAIRKFHEMLTAWQRLSDETRMRSTERLLMTLGDSARYAELMARRSIKEQDFAGAEKWLERAIHKNPNYMRAMKLLAELYMSTGRFSQALAIFEKLQLSSPRNIQRLTRMGQCLVAVGEYQKAEKLLLDTVAIDEYFVDARETLGKVKCALGDYDTARLLLASSQKTRELAAFFNILGVRFVEQQSFDQAIRHYKKAQFVLPGNEQGHLLFFNIALAYLKWGQVKQALSYARLAVAREPLYEKASKLVSLLEKRLSA